MVLERRLGRWLLVSLLSACAHGGGAGECPEATPAATKEAAEPPATAPVPREYRLIDGLTGLPIDDAGFAERLRAARVVLVGEQHDDPHHHFVQLRVFERLVAEDSSVALGLEMLSRDRQNALDAFVRKRSDEKAFLAAVDWENTWGFPFGLYRPLLMLARERGLAAHALNAPRALTRAVAKKGIDGLEAAERAALPDMVPGPAAHREYAREAYGMHARSRFTGAKFERFYTAQLLWDETMAETVANALTTADAPHRMLVLAGEGHTRPFAMPARIARRGIGPQLLVLAIEPEQLEAAVAERAADVLFVFAAESKPATPAHPHASGGNAAVASR